ncbi:hypothetical protein QBC40DRAFT_272678 [Triangularia verruculosa]|uniref:Uncharacterized protein n=1 Tax=Triangularia verruculosa TaxID=2587418 RepID=A0AAN6XPY4_9PEZI|nr:hypothetical protein QBC40DRAFT_272678 [Triangularia verruculosa]
MPTRSYPTVVRLEEGSWSDSPCRCCPLLTSHAVVCCTALPYLEPLDALDAPLPVATAETYATPVPQNISALVAESLVVTRGTMPSGKYLSTIRCFHKVARTFGFDLRIDPEHLSPTKRSPHCSPEGVPKRGGEIIAYRPAGTFRPPPPGQGAEGKVLKTPTIADTACIPSACHLVDAECLSGKHAFPRRPSGVETNGNSC